MQTIRWTGCFGPRQATNAESASGDLYREVYAQVGALATGATTSKWILGHARLLDKPAGRPYSGRRSRVFSHRQPPAVPGADIRFASGDVRAGHKDISIAAGQRNIWLVGGGDLIGQVADQGLRPGE